MTITANPVRDEYTASAAQTVFNYTFKIFDGTDLNVYLTPAGADADDTADLITSYTVAGVGAESGGAITLNSGAAAGDSITIVSDIPESRATDYQVNGDFIPDTVNDDFDRVVSLVKQVDEKASRAVVFEQSVQQSSNLTFPAPLAQNFLRWKADLTGMENVTPLSQGVFVPADFIENIENIAGLRNYSGTADTIYVLGYYDQGDGGGNAFYWDGANAEADNGGTVIKPTATVGGGRWIAVDRLTVTAKQFGLKGDKTTDDSAAMGQLIASDALSIRFTEGVYQSGFNNATSNRTFYCEEGSIIDGVAHISTGSGPEVGGGPVVTVENVSVIGTITSTIRVGTFYCSGFTADKIRITEIDASYVNQTINGGTSGVHLYVASHDIEIGEIIVESATKDLYGLGIDLVSIISDANKPTDISIGKYTVRNCDQAAIAISNTVRLRIDEVVVDSYDGIGAGFSSATDEDLYIGRITMDGASSAASKDAIYLLTSKGAYFGDIDIKNATQIGFRVDSAAAEVIRVGSAKVVDSTLDNFRLESKVIFGDVETSGAAGTGFNVPVAGDGCRVGSIVATANTGPNITITAPNVTIDDIITHTAAATYGLLLNSTALNFKNDYIEAYGLSQGIRCLTAGPVDMGVMNLHDNTNGFLGSTMDKFSFNVVRYATNGTDTNTDFTGLAGYNGKLYDSRHGETVRGDADLTLAVETAKQVQRFGTPLVAPRVITLSAPLAPQPGDNLSFRIVRTAAASGASGLDVGGIKTLAAAEWCDVEFTGAVWVLTAFGTL